MEHFRNFILKASSFPGMRNSKGFKQRKHIFQHMALLFCSTKVKQKLCSKNTYFVVDVTVWLEYLCSECLSLNIDVSSQKVCFKMTNS